MPEGIMADLAWFSALFIVFCSELEKEEEEKKKMMIFNFFKCRCHDFYKAELKSEIRRVVDIYFVDFWHCLHVHSPLPTCIVLSKYFNHPHPYIEIATAISDSDIATLSLVHTHLDKHTSIPGRLLS